MDTLLDDLMSFKTNFEETVPTHMRNIRIKSMDTVG